MRVEDSRMFRVKELAELLDVHRSTVYRAIESGQLDALKIGTGKGALRIPGASVNTWLNTCAEAAYSPAADDVTGDDAAEVA
ncbi:helix-turn-helix domain-containing protein [Amycolatopsis ultiminotia]